MATVDMSNLTMNMFGMPYQFSPAVDPRLSLVSSTVGKKFTENIMLEAPICTIIPGVPSYLPGTGDTTLKISTAQALLEGQEGNFNALKQLFSDKKSKDMRLYDFESAYNEYMSYVNVLCRAGASFLELKDTITAGSRTYSFQRYDWRHYRWNTSATKSFNKRLNTAIASLSSTSNEGDYSTAKDANVSSSLQFMMESSTDNSTEKNLKDVLTNYNYVQFYIDPDVSPNESLTNSTGESNIKSMFDTGSSMMKELAFIANSGGIDAQKYQEFAANSAASLQSGVEKYVGNNTIGSALSRLINLGGEVLKGDNLLIPDMYQNSQYSKDYSITVHLKSPYGTKLGYYMDVFVPLMHLMALAMPRQASANTFSSPFLVKAYVDGIFTCNLGIVNSISIQRTADSYSVAGLPSEVDVTLNITDLYCDLMMSPSTSPIKFVNNSSLIEYIATNCGIDLTAPNYKAKWNNAVNSVTNAFTDIPTTVKSSINENIYKLIGSVTSLY